MSDYSNSSNTTGGVSKDPTAGVLPPRKRPEVKALLKEMREALETSSDVCHRMEENEKVRATVWAGQSEDGRKHEEDMGQEPFPYEGASDARIRLAALLIRERKNLCRAAMVGGRVNAVPVDSGTDPATAAGVLPMLMYLVRQMKVNIRNESDYLLDWSGMSGHAILGIRWNKEMRLEPRTVTRDDVVAVAVREGLLEEGLPSPEEMAAAAEQQQQVQGGEVLDGGGGPGAGQTGGLTSAVGRDAQPPANEGTGVSPVLEAVGVVQQRSLEEVQAMLLDASQDERLRELLLKLDPTMPESEARSVATQLRNPRNAVATYYRPYVHAEGPEWEALSTMRDVFFPRDTYDLQKAPWIVWVHRYTEDQLRNRAELEGWDKEVTEKMLRLPGSAFDLSQMKLGSWVLGGSSWRLKRASAEDVRETKRFEVLEVFYRATAIQGASCIYREIIHGKIEDKSALHEACPHWHGKMPFVEFRRMREGSKFLLDVDGIPEEVRTQQNEIKFQHDGRTNRTDMVLSPPATVPMNRGGGRLNLGPNAQIPMRRSGTLDFLKLPQMDMDTVAITRETWGLVNALYCRPVDGVPQQSVVTHQQVEVDDWLTDLSAAWEMTYDLAQEHIPDAQWELITGSPKPARDRRRIDFSITFDVRDLNIEYLREKLELLSAFVVPNDSEGVIDRAGLAGYVFAAIDPVMAKQLVRSGEDAAQREEEDELTALAVIMAGEEPPQKEGQNHGLRAAVLKRAVARSLEVQSKLMTNEQIREVYQARLQFHENQVQQQQNAIIGRTMRQPVLGENG